MWLLQPHHGVSCMYQYKILYKQLHSILNEYYLPTQTRATYETTTDTGMEHKKGTKEIHVFSMQTC